METGKTKGKNTLKSKLLATGLAASIAITGTVGLTGCDDGKDEPAEPITQEQTPTNNHDAEGDKQPETDPAYDAMVNSAYDRARDLLNIGEAKSVDSIFILWESEASSAPLGFRIVYIDGSDEYASTTRNETGIESTYKTQVDVPSDLK
jgi:hypothetical protein